MKEHTKTPWEIDFANPEMVYTEYVDSDGASTYICDCDSDILPQKEYEANAAFIVRACNCHDSLINACEALIKYHLDWLESDYTQGFIDNFKDSVLYKQTIETIAKARGEQ